MVVCMGDPFIVKVVALLRCTLSWGLSDAGIELNARNLRYGGG